MKLSLLPAKLQEAPLFSISSLLNHCGVYQFFLVDFI